MGFNLGFKGLRDREGDEKNRKRNRKTETCVE